MGGGLLAGLAALHGVAAPAAAAQGRNATYYGLIGRIDAVDGERDALVSILVDGLSLMPGCLSYIVARDPAAPDAVWVTEVWETAEAHAASLDLETVAAAIERARPLIAGVSRIAETEPVGGHGLIQACVAPY